MLELLSHHQEGFTVSQIAKELEIPRNSAFRISATLQEHGYIGFHQGSQRLVLTKKMFSVGYRALATENIVQVAYDAMRSLRDETKETVLIGSLMQHDGAVLEELAGLHHFNFRVERGARFYLHCTAPGKAILAHLSQAEQAKLVDTITLTRFNDNTITDKERLLEELKQIKHQGVAYDHAEQIEGCHCIAAPVINQYGYPIAAIWVTGPSSRMPTSDFEKLGQRIKDAAATVSQQLSNGTH